MSGDPNPYRAPIQASTGAELAAALSRFTIEDLRDAGLTVMTRHGVLVGDVVEVEWNAHTQRLELRAASA